MSVGFTPGPWSVERIDYDKYGMDASFEVNAGFRTIVQTHMREIKSEAEWLAADEANCRLIAAAPALYVLLERASECVHDELADEIDAALKQARGEQ